MASGKIKFFLHKQGFGFIVPDDGSTDRFFHRENMVEPGRQLLQNQRVVFEALDHPKGKRATNVKLEGSAHADR